MGLLAFEGVADLMSTVLMVTQRLGQPVEILGILPDPGRWSHPTDEYRHRRCIGENMGATYSTPTFQ